MNPQLVLRPAALGAELGLTASEAHAAVERAVAAKLAIKDGAGKPAGVRAALKTFVQHGAPYCFPATQRALSTRRSGRAATLHRCGQGKPLPGSTEKSMVKTPQRGRSM